MTDEQRQHFNDWLKALRSGEYEPNTNGVPGLFIKNWGGITMIAKLPDTEGELDRFWPRKELGRRHVYGYRPLDKITISYE